MIAAWIPHVGLMAPRGQGGTATAPRHAEAAPGQREARYPASQADRRSAPEDARDHTTAARLARTAGDGLGGAPDLGVELVVEALDLLGEAARDTAAIAGHDLRRKLARGGALTVTPALRSEPGELAGHTIRRELVGVHCQRTCRFGGRPPG